MASIAFYDGNGQFQIGSSGGSGIGFYGSGGFGTSIPITTPATYNSYSFITNSGGTASGQQISNIARTASGSGSINGSGNVILTAIPNYLSTCNIRFSHSSNVRTLNSVLRIYDRSNIDNGPSGVSCYCASIIHSGTTQVNNGSGSSGWTLCSGSGSTLSMATSPGTSGLSPSGSSTVDTRHDYYAAISCTPLSIGSKTSFGLYFSTEYV